MLLVVLFFIVPAQGVRPGFQPGAFAEWRDCGVGDSWVSVKQFDFQPGPLDTNWEFTTSFDAIITHSIADQVSLDVLIEKKLLGSYSKLPCLTSFGSCRYTYPCHFLNTYQRLGTCPPQLTANSISCTCPFHPAKLHMSPSKFSISINREWKAILEDADLHVRITINDIRDQHVRGCFEAYLTTDIHGGLFQR